MSMRAQTVGIASWILGLAMILYVVPMTPIVGYSLFAALIMMPFGLAVFLGISPRLRDHLFFGVVIVGLLTFNMSMIINNYLLGDVEPCRTVAGEVITDIGRHSVNVAYCGEQISLR